MNPRDIAPEIAAVAGKYNYKKPPDFLLQLQEWIDKAWRFAAELLASLRIHMPGMSDTNVVGNIIQAFVIITGILCLVVIVLVSMRRLSQLNAQSRLAKQGQTAQHRLLDAAGWKEEAAVLADKQDWREACRAIYMSSLRAMHESAVIDFAPTRTNYEYWYALSPRSAVLAHSFRALANQVELIWFGNKQATSADYDKCCQELVRVEEQCQSIKHAAAREIANKR